MATFSAVNSSPAAQRSNGMEDARTATAQGYIEDRNRNDFPCRSSNADDSSPRTPTRYSFGGVPGQRPLPSEPPRASQVHNLMEPATPSKRDESHLQKDERSTREPRDVDMGDGDEEENEDDVSDNESITSDSQRPSKKKKGQRFFCTDFPPCQLSFTRSEHLARHIRKHTGERPFQCHCSRRFSRLDNLRQHAQTVHVNEEIPGDSLAATSTRFQRQIRTDRVRPPTSRSRASTLGSQSGHARGHSRNLSTSSIGSTTSSIGNPEDGRRRPQPLAMANDINGRALLSSSDTYAGAVGSPPQYMYYNQSSSGLSTPTSTTFSTRGQSPGPQSLMASPSSSLGRSSYYNGARAQNRRLSVPSANNPFQSQSSYAVPPPFFQSLQSPQSSNFSQTSSVYGSPTSSVFSHGRRDSDADMEYRRRTWHPSTSSQYAQRPATSGLTYHQTPDEPRPAFTQQQAASQMTRLPGIESFDHAPPPTARSHPSPMMIDSLPRPTSSGRPADAALYQGLTRLDINRANAPAEAQWQPLTSQPYHASSQGPPVAKIVQQKHISMPESPVTPRSRKRDGWYGPPQVPIFGGPSYQSLPHRTSPEDSGSSDGVPTPSTSQGPEYNPVIINPSGPAEAVPPSHAIADESKISRADSGYNAYIHPPSQPHLTYSLQVGHEGRYSSSGHAQPNNGYAKLEALVAVATSEEHRS